MWRYNLTTRHCRKIENRTHQDATKEYPGQGNYHFNISSALNNSNHQIRSCEKIGQYFLTNKTIPFLIRSMKCGLGYYLTFYVSGKKGYCVVKTLPHALCPTRPDGLSATYVEYFAFFIVRIALAPC